MEQAQQKDDAALKAMEEKFLANAGRLKTVKSEIAKIIFGQEDVIDKTLITLLSGGHALLIGVPGLAKTLLVETVSVVMGLSAGRVQCTPDLMPSDILGSEVLEEDSKGKRAFRFIQGPVFSQFLMADEINRSSPRTQSALLQAMQEKKVSVSGQEHNLPEPFHVLATQNPIEQEGTYPLPEAQLDRFLMQIDVGYPDLEAEQKMLIATTTGQAVKPRKILSNKELIDLQKFILEMPIGQKVVDAILKLVRDLRPGPGADEKINKYVSWAPGPRASQALMLTVRAKALLEGREAPAIQDVKDLAPSVLKHRMALNYEGQTEGITAEGLIEIMSKNI